MADLKVAQGNASVLHDFFEITNNVYVSDSIHFCLLTGMTRYAVHSTGSGPDHLDDISLDPEYAGICGFTLEEFGPLFADRMAPALASLKAAGTLPPSSDLADLSLAIHHWYGGYNWGGKTRILNPYSILNFFNTNVFDQYWIKSGRPSHLTSLFKSNPLDFITTKPIPYSWYNLLNCNVQRLQILPTLFYSGYLTIDTIEYIKPNITSYSFMGSDQFYNFKFTNNDVTSIYISDVFMAIYDVNSPNDFLIWRDELHQAFLARDTQAVSGRFSQLLSPITRHQRIKNDETFHILVQSLLSTMGFKILGDLSGAKECLDLTIELPDDIYVIINLKYCQNRINLTDNEKIDALSPLAIDNLEQYDLDIGLANAVRDKISTIELFSIYSKNRLEFNNNYKENRLLASIAKNYLSKLEFDTALAFAAKCLLSSKSDDVLWRTSQLKLSKEQIDAKLTTAIAEALTQIEKGRRHEPFELQAKEFIDLGLALYGDGFSVKAAFRPKQPSNPAPKRPPKRARA
jgi:hypothetical protein